MAISSMTGFARVQVHVPLGGEEQLSYTLTVKSVNHRFLDLQFRLPNGLEAQEMELRRYSFSGLPSEAGRTVGVFTLWWSPPRQPAAEVQRIASR